MVLATLAGLLGPSGCSVPAAGPQEAAGRADPIISGEREHGLDGVVGIMLLDSRGGHRLICTGTALSQRVVLTAKHCVYDDVSGVREWEPRDLDRLFVGIGSDLSNTSAIRNVVGVFDVMTTAGFDVRRDLSTGDDIALLRTTEDLLVDTTFRVGLMAPRLADPITLVGYGRRMAGPSVPGDYGLKNRGDASVDRVYAGVFTTIGTSWLCHGDSGGPAFDASMQVVGINSFVSSSRCDDMFGGYTEVTHHTPLVVAALTADTPCFEREEVCDGRDNDCDGLVDDVGCFEAGDGCEDAAQCRTGRCEETPSGRVCTRGCDPTEPEACGGGLACEADACGEGRCVPALGGALEDGAECAEDADCAAGRCAATPGGASRCGRACAEGAPPCGEGMACDTSDGACGTCLPVGVASGVRVTGDACDADDRCAAGDCVDGACSRPCGDGAPCPAGMHCRGDVCAPGPLGGAGDRCVSADDCGEAAPACARDGETLCAAPCPSGACAMGATCTRTAEGPFCLPTGTALGDRCDGDAQCRSGACEGGRCSAACEAAWQCPTGFDCHDSRCVRETGGGCGVTGSPSAPAPTLLLLMLAALSPRGRARRTRP